VYSVYTKYEQACARIRELSAGVASLEAALRKILFECDTIEAAAREARVALATQDREGEHG
jgi:hypothetical protein